MGIMYDPNAPEEVIAIGCGMTVLGIRNDYVWCSVIGHRDVEDCYISLKILDSTGDVMISMALGNNVVFKRTIDDTIDCFLYWIFVEKPDFDEIRNQVESSLCVYDTMFITKWTNRMAMDKRAREEEERIAEQKGKEENATMIIDSYCRDNYMYCHYDFNDVYVVDVLDGNVWNIFSNANFEMMALYIEFMRKNPENNQCHLVDSGNPIEVAERLGLYDGRRSL